MLLLALKTTQMQWRHTGDLIGFFEDGWKANDAQLTSECADDAVVDDSHVTHNGATLTCSNVNNTKHLSLDDIPQVQAALQPQNTHLNVLYSIHKQNILHFMQ